MDQFKYYILISKLARVAIVMQALLEMVTMISMNGGKCLANMFRPEHCMYAHVVMSGRCELLSSVKGSQTVSIICRRTCEMLVCVRVRLYMTPVNK